MENGNLNPAARSIKRPSRFLEKRSAEASEVIPAPLAGGHLGRITWQDQQRFLPEVKARPLTLVSRFEYRERPQKESLLNQWDSNLTISGARDSQEK
jgi:hypothetical protein